MISRRCCLSGISLLACLPLLEAVQAKGRPVSQLLVRACWQSFSMGEVAQVAGLLQLLQRALPTVKLTVWASSLGHGVGEWLRRHFPKVKFLTGTTGRDGKPDQPALEEAWELCDFFLHGPSTQVVARDHLEAWQKHTRKPFGLYGVTLGVVDDRLKSLLNAAAFVLLRDGASRALAVRQGLDVARVGFVPDAALAMNLQNEAKASVWLKAHGLQDKKFICVVPKLRFTPYWEIFERQPKYRELAQVRINQQYREEDHELLRTALGKFLQATDMHLLCVAEMPYQVALGETLLEEKFPATVQSRCVVRQEPWLPDEAASIFAKAQLVLSMELLSAAVAQTVGTACIHLRAPTDATQGQMWRDLGLQDWLFEMDPLNATALGEALLRIKEEPEARAKTLTMANEFIREGEIAGMKRVRDALAEAAKF